MSLLSFKLIKPSTELAIPLEQAKLFLKVDSDQENSLITDLIKSVSRQFEHYTSTALLQQGWYAHYLMQDNDTFLLPITPVIKVEKLTISGRYAQDKLWEGPYALLGDRLILQYVPIAEQIGIYFDSGITKQPSGIPVDIISKMLRHLAFLYENRDGQTNYNMECYYEYKRHKL